MSRDKPQHKSRKESNGKLAPADHGGVSFRGIGTALEKIGAWGAGAAVLIGICVWALSHWRGSILIAIGAFPIVIFTGLHLAKRSIRMRTIATLIAVATSTFIFVKVPQEQEEAFAVYPRVKVVLPEKPRYWLVWNNAAERVASPIHIEMFLDITSLKAGPITVRSYAFECETENGGWVLAPSVDTRDGKLVFVMNATFDLTRTGRIMQEEPILPAAFEGKTIGPFGEVHAWAYLECPTNKITRKIRLKVRDTKNAEYIQQVADLNETNYLDMPIRFGTTTFTGEMEDISGCPKLRYSDYFIMH